MGRASAAADMMAYAGSVDGPSCPQPVTPSALSPSPTPLQREPSPRATSSRKKKALSHPMNKQTKRGSESGSSKKKLSKQSIGDSMKKSRSETTITKSIDRCASSWSLGSQQSQEYQSSAQDYQSQESLDSSAHSLDSFLQITRSMSDPGSRPQRNPNNSSRNSPFSDNTSDVDSELASLSEGNVNDLPPGWVMHHTGDGKPYFVNKTARTTTWLDPRTNRPCAATQQEGVAPAQTTDEWNIPLPEGWEMGVTESGTKYFIDHVNRTTSWTDPRMAFSGYGGSREAQRQRLRIEQCNLRNAEIKLQVEMIKKQQAILDQDMSKSASAETIMLAKAKAQQDAYNKLSSRMQHESVQRQIASRLSTLQRDGLTQVPELSSTEGSPHHPSSAHEADLTSLANMMSKPSADSKQDLVLSKMEMKVPLDFQDSHVGAHIGHAGTHAGTEMMKELDNTFYDDTATTEPQLDFDLPDLGDIDTSSLGSLPIMSNSPGEFFSGGWS